LRLQALQVLDGGVEQLVVSVRHRQHRSGGAPERTKIFLRYEPRSSRREEAPKRFAVMRWLTLVLSTIKPVPIPLPIIPLPNGFSLFAWFAF
jgi:hypothetical protein